MTDQSNVFKKQEEQQQSQEPLAQEQPQSVDAFSDQLKTITAEDGRQKYGTVEEALKALAHSQTFIPDLQQQLATAEQEKTTLREELAKTKGVQETVDALTNHQQQSQEGDPSETKFGEEDIAALVVKTLDKRNLEATKQTNSSKVNDALVHTFGDKAAETVALKAKELNTTPEALGALAETSPDMVLALFQTKPSSTSITNTSFNMGHERPAAQPLAPPEKSLLSGASMKEQVAYMKKIKEEVYAKHGITE